MPTTHVALLRGINVGGHAKVGMDDLRWSFVAMGYADVRTYIQSGNVLFTTAAGKPPPDAGAIEQHLGRALGVPVTVVLRTAEELADVAAANPYLARGADPDALYVTFLGEVPDPGRASGLVAPPSTADELTLVGREVYVHCPGGYGRTKLHNTFVERHLGVGATTRSWRTLGKLRQLVGG